MKTAAKYISIILSLILVLNLILMALGKLSVLIFWLIIILSAISSYIIRTYLI